MTSEYRGEKDIPENESEVGVFETGVMKVDNAHSDKPIIESAEDEDDD